MPNNRPMAANVGPSPTGVEPLRAPLFRDIASRLGEDGRWVVLDLGAPRGSTIEFFGGHGSRLIIADVMTALNELNAAEDAGAAARCLDGLLPPLGPVPVDLVLSWDLLNFLAPVAFSTLMARIGTGMRRGAALHALMSYAAPQMPIEPGSYAVGSGGELVGRDAGADARKPMGYPADKLQRMMCGYTVVRSVLLRQGMQEYVFRYMPLATNSQSA